MAELLHIPVDGPLELKLRSNHQLRHVDIPKDGGKGSPKPPQPGAPSLFEQLQEWSKLASFQIKAAVDSQAISSNNVNWEIEVFTLLESGVVYLRDTDKVFEAVLEARKRTEEGDERALQLLKDSQADIKTIAALWGLDFEVICDLLKYSPDGHPLLNGPFAGVFYSKDTKKPFLGLAFKGTNVKDWKEIFVDLKFVMQLAVGDILWGSPIHSGFYETMFLEFPDVQSIPLAYIKYMIDQFLQTYLVPEGIPIYLHTTGHSLGGAYATLCYAELMRLYNDDPTKSFEASKDNKYHELAVFFPRLEERQFFVQDLYTFGCPRVGGVKQERDWAKQYSNALKHHTGQSWRVVNKYDPVTTVPPVFPVVSIWNHIDNGYEISEEALPRPLPSEIDTQPGVDFKPWNAPYHSLESYFQNLYNASVGRGNEIVIGWIEKVPPESEWSAMEAEAQALLSE